jgi:hypothetical protein
MVDDVVSDWSELVYRELGTLHHFDLRPGAAVYRAFVLPDALEIDLGLTPATEFGSVGEGGFRLVFGEAVEARPGNDDSAHLIGLTWHHVPHARTAIERGTWWQAEYWIRAIRDNKHPGARVPPVRSAVDLRERRRQIADRTHRSCASSVRAVS